MKYIPISGTREVKDCDSCIHCQMGSDEEFHCFHPKSTKKHKDYWMSPPDNIPSWCPLPDYHVDEIGNDLVLLERELAQKVSSFKIGDIIEHTMGNPDRKEYSIILDMRVDGYDLPHQKVEHYGKYCDSGGNAYGDLIEITGIIQGPHNRVIRGIT